MASFFQNQLIFKNLADFIQLNSTSLFPFSFYLNGLIIVFMLSFIIKSFTRVRKSDASSQLLSSASRDILKLFKKPLLIFFMSYVLYLTCVAIHAYYPKIASHALLSSIAYVIEIFTLLWVIKKILSYSKDHLSRWFATSNHPLMHIVFRVLSNSLTAIFYIIIINLVVSYIQPMGLMKDISEKALRLFLIGTIGWIVLKIIEGIEQLIISKNSSPQDNIYDSRKIITQVKILKKVLSAVCVIIMVAAMLMVFDSVRSIGTGLLTTAGILGAVGAFASQKSLAGLFSGLHLAFTQPIRIGDTVVIDQESGQVEEITLSYVVIKLWDLRRLILPTDYFTSKGIVNLTRNSSELVGSIILFVDYTLKTDVLRKQFNTLLKNSPLWDQKISSFEVTELREQSVQIRALVSAKNSSDLWKLRCDIREKLLQFMAHHHPTMLPKTRQMSIDSNELNTSHHSEMSETVKIE